ncbi:hypothetical protein R3P38DRAFT_2879080 [Favolaschia claudopus]|uniref:Uncharacterized protein n=1 Tax=Favolaschia claudopus TaxID=2862362 RepID=A0AAW0CZA3_9AGAR
MSPSMSINVALASQASSSAASSPSSSSGVYVPVHKRTGSAMASTSQRTFAVYTVPELIRLAKSPMVKEATTVMHAALNIHPAESVAELTSDTAEDSAATPQVAFMSEILLSRKKQRAREYSQRQNIKNNSQQVVVVQPAPAPRRRTPLGRATDRNGSLGRRSGATKFMEAASWRVPQPMLSRHATPEVQPSMGLVV